MTDKANNPVIHIETNNEETGNRWMFLFETCGKFLDGWVMLNGQPLPPILCKAVKKEYKLALEAAKESVAQYRAEHMTMAA